MIWELLHKLILGPLELLFDAVYTVSYRITGSPGGSIILLSIAVNLLLLPLFRRVDAVQQEERLQAQLLKPGIENLSNGKMIPLPEKMQTPYFLPM